jgi:hypothetical protein
LFRVQLKETLRQSDSKKERRATSPAAGSKYVVDEIKAYIAIRDSLLVEAEQVMTRAKIDSATVANNFVITCLKPAQPPYEAQCLPKADAAREGKRCQEVKARLAELSARIPAGKPRRHHAETH